MRLKVVALFMAMGADAFFSQIDYSTLASRLINSRPTTNGTSTSNSLIDEQDTMLMSLTSGTILGVWSLRHRWFFSGDLNVVKGFTGQYLDASGLNYDHARYYDPVVGRFVSADTKQGNGQGMDPYSYVGNKPETRNDPTGQRFCDPTGNQCGHPCADNCSPGDGGCSANWHPPMMPCGGSGGDNPKRVSTVPAGCTQGEKVRQQRLAALHDQLGWERIAADVLVALGLLINWAAGTSITSTVSLVLGLLALFGNNLLPDVIAKLGNDSGLVEGLYRCASVLQQAAGWLEGAAAIYNGAAWWKKEVIDASVSAFKFGSLGPEQVMISALLLLAKPVVGVLLDSGAQFLYGKAFSDQADYEKQGSMPIKQWCAAYQAC